jgi:hypothetical protein
MKKDNTEAVSKLRFVTKMECNNCKNLHLMSAAAVLHLRAFSVSSD